MLVQSLDHYGEFDNHSLVVPVEEAGIPLKGFIAIHRQYPGFASLGATRVWAYESDELALRDVLRLSRLMSYKSVLAGLPYGGAKAALILPPGGLKNRELFFRTYGKHVEALKGAFVTGTDVGVSNSDLGSMLQETRYVIGQGVDAGYFTALGVFEGVKVVLCTVFGSEEVADRRFAIQGLGKTGWNLLKLLYEVGARSLYVADLDVSKVQEALRAFPGIHSVGVEEIYACDVDVFCPCGLGGTLNQQTVQRLKCRAIVGSANNQLAEMDVGTMLANAEIIYAPDYLVNAGGIISVVDQYEHQIHDENRIKEKINHIAVNLKHVVDISLSSGQPTHSVADQIAEQMLFKPVVYAHA